MGQQYGLELKYCKTTGLSTRSCRSWFVANNSCCMCSHAEQFVEWEKTTKKTAKPKFSKIIIIIETHWYTELTFSVVIINYIHETDEETIAAAVTVHYRLHNF